MQPEESLASPQAVSLRLKVTDSTLRRYARDYEQVFDDLPRDERGGRLYPDEAVDRLERAQELTRSGQVSGMRAAFEVLSCGGETTEQDPTLEALKVVHEELLTLHFRMDKLEQHRVPTENDEMLRVYREEILRLQAQLARPIGKRPWWRLWEARG